MFETSNWKGIQNETSSVGIDLNISWKDKVTNEDLYGDLLKVTRKVRACRSSAAGHFYHHQKEAVGTLVLWDPRHGSGSPGSHHETYVQVLLEDTGLENISERISFITIYGSLLLLTDMMMMIDHGWNDDDDDR